MNTRLALAALVLTVAGAMSTLRGQLIYADTFQYGSGYPGINGQTPTIYDPSGAKWTGNSGYLFTTGDDSALLTSNGGQALAYLPLNLTTNTTYSFSLTLAPSAAESSWQEMGFINTSIASANQIIYNNGGAADLGPTLIFGPGAGPGNGNTASGIQLFNGTIGAHSVSVSTPADAQANNPQTFTFELTTGATLGTYTYSVQDTESDGVTTVDLADNISYTGTISGIELGTFYQGGTISDLLVSSQANAVTVPEPSTYCMLFGGLLALLGWQRRVRARAIRG